MARARKRKPPTPPPPVNPADVPLTDEQMRFVDEWLIDHKNGLAYMRVYPNCRSHRAARAQGCLMRHLPNVEAEIRSRQQELRIRRAVDSELVIREIQCLAFSDILDLFDHTTGQLRQPRHIPFDARKAVSSIKVSRQRRTVTRSGKTRTTVTEQVVEYKLWNKLDALGKLCRWLGLETEITPLEALLAALPRHMAQEIRDHLTKHNTAPKASANGKH